MLKKYISEDKELMKEWVWKKNKNLDPSQLLPGSNRKAWWKCAKCGYEWETKIIYRAGEDHTGCPACANKVLVVGLNDLETKYPDIAKEWHPTKNGNLTPTDIIATSHKKVWWKCSRGHDYEQAIFLKTTRGHGCPYCSHNKVLKGFNDLATKYPEIAKEWHPTKNGKLKPTDISYGSHRKVWWLSPVGFEYEQAINKKIRPLKTNNPYKKNKLIKGFNDFQTIFPKIAEEWHTTKNGKLTPSDVTAGSGKRVWWQCPIGHEYQAVVRERGSGRTNCPICNIRRSSSFAEQAIFHYIKQIFPDTCNRYKRIFNSSMELDIFIPSLNIAIEYDGINWHKTEEEHKREIKKYNLCKKHGIVLYRVKETSKNNWDNVSDKIYYLKKVKRNDFHELEKVILLILSDIKANIKDKNINITKINIDIEKDKNKIQSYLSKIAHSLQEERPDVASKWNYEKNRNLKPNMFSVASNEIVWWKCPECGNEWKSSVNSMTRKGRYGCAICALKHRGKTFTKNVVKKIGSLAETMPDLAKEWHPIKNGNLTPNDITAGRFKHVWWLCPKCGYEWQASPNHRKRGVGCPCCRGRVPKSGANDLETKFPEIAKEWHYEKNKPLIPKNILPGSGKKVWWKCSKCGYEWKALIHRRVKGFHKCPNCHGLPQLPLKY